MKRRLPIALALATALCCVSAATGAHAGAPPGASAAPDSSVAPGGESTREAWISGARAWAEPVSATLDERAQGSWYNADYIFALSRGLAGSTVAPPLKPVLFIVTIPLDLALLPFALIGGLFG